MAFAHRVEFHVGELAGLLEAIGEQHWSYLLRITGRDLTDDPDRAIARLRTLVDGRGGLASLRIGDAAGQPTGDYALESRFEQVRATLCEELASHDV
jgi:hypothetical protein